MLPHNDVRGGAVLAVVEEDDPGQVSNASCVSAARGRHSHGIGVHGLAGVELPVLEVGNDLLGEAGGARLERLDLLGRLALLLELGLDGLHVACDAQMLVSACRRPQNQSRGGVWCFVPLR